MGNHNISKPSSKLSPGVPKPIPKSFHFTKIKQAYIYHIIYMFMNAIKA